MRRAIYITMIVGLLLVACTPTIYKHLPEGFFYSNDHRIELRTDGTFFLENIGNTNDPRNFTIEGDYTSTLDLYDEDNDTYGKITFTPRSLALEGSDVSTLYLDDEYLSEASKVSSGDKLEGWWAYSENITWGGMMRVWFNWPGITRGNNFYDGHNELFSGDP